MTKPKLNKGDQYVKSTMPRAKQETYGIPRLGIWFVYPYGDVHLQGKTKGILIPKYDPSSFAPEKLDCEQWIKTAAEAGMRYAVLTCKHHEGFCLWPSEYGDYSTKYSSWRNGQGDVVKDFTDACHKFPYDNACPHYKTDHKAYDDYFINHMRDSAPFS